MNTYLQIVIQFSDMSEPENNCSVLTVATKCEVCGCSSQMFDLLCFCSHLRNLLSCLAFPTDKFFMLHCSKVVLCMFTHTVRIDVIMSSFFVTDKPATPYKTG